MEVKEIRTEEISEYLRKQIADFEKKIDVSEVGVVTYVGDGVARIYGLENAMMSELLEFPNDVIGMVLNLEEDAVGAVLFGDDKLIKEGDIVKRTGRIMSVPVGEALIGRVVDALGRPIDGKGPIKLRRQGSLMSLPRELSADSLLKSPSRQVLRQ
jgi:F-type H+-transporting ATPase subunit alpha